MQPGRRLLHRATGLEVPVQSAIVFVGARKVTVRRGGPADVTVLPNPRALRRWLCKQPPALPTDQVEAIYEAARRPASWQTRISRATASGTRVSSRSAGGLDA